MEKIIPDKHNAIERPGNDNKIGWINKNEPFWSISYVIDRAIFSRQGICPTNDRKVNMKKTEEFMQILLCDSDQLLSEYEAQSHILV